MNKRTVIGLLSTLLLCTTLGAQPVVKTGIEVLKERGFDLLRGKRVGLITNPSGVDASLNSTIDILAAAPGVTLAALFGPEHGVRGDFAAGDKIESSTDSRTGIPAYSLYGKTSRPTPEMLAGIDVLVYDVQDIGCRSYTYITTMSLAMEAAAKHRIPFVVLDRPNPLGGIRMEGSIVEKPFKSHVSMFPIPYVYGLTCGELARLLNEEKMLTDSVSCDLTVVPMRGWKRSMIFQETGLPWVPTSPHVPRDVTAHHYVTTGILGELGVISEGVGYTLPFETLAAEWIDPALLAERMNALKLEGVIFRPITYKPFYGRSAGKQLHGVQVHLLDPAKINLMAIQFLFMQVHQELYPHKNPFRLADSSRIRMFDKVSGSDQVRLAFEKRMQYGDVKTLLEKDLEKFRTTAKKYTLYDR